MRIRITFLVLAVTVWLATGCKEGRSRQAATEVPVIGCQEKERSLADLAYELLTFEKYEIALDLVKEDTTLTADGVRTHAYDALGNTREAIHHAVPYLRTKDTTSFYEGSYECCDLYDIFKKDAEYGLKVLGAEYKRCPSNYQIRQLMMKLYWYLDDYYAVVRMGNEFREELPDMSSEVTFNCLRQAALDAIDSLKVASAK